MAGGHSLILQGHVNRLPPSEPEQLIADIPANSQLLEMMCLLLHNCKSSLSFKAITFLVHNFEDVHAKFGGCEGLLLKYLINHPSPLSIVAAVVRVIRLEIQARGKTKPTSLLKEALTRFQQLQHELLLRSQSFVVGFEANQGIKLMRLQALLDFKLEPIPKTEGGGVTTRPEPGTVSDFRPLRVAFADRDADFMISPIVESFTRLRW